MKGITWLGSDQGYTLYKTLSEEDQLKVLEAEVQALDYCTLKYDMLSNAEKLKVLQDEVDQVMVDEAKLLKEAVSRGQHVGGDNDEADGKKELDGMGLKRYNLTELKKCTLPSVSTGLNVGAKEFIPSVKEAYPVHNFEVWTINAAGAYKIAPMILERGSHHNINAVHWLWNRQLLGSQIWLQCRVDDTKIFGKPDVVNPVTKYMDDLIGTREPEKNRMLGSDQCFEEC